MKACSDPEIASARAVTVPLSVLAHDPNKAVQYYNCSEALLGALMEKFQ